MLELAQLNHKDTNDYRFCSEEIKQTAFRLDGILTPPKEKIDLPIIFVEFQFQPDQNFYSRFFCEIFFYLHQNKPIQPWQAVIIYPTRKTETKGSLHYKALLKSDQVKRVYLEDLVNPPSDKIGLQLIQLIVIEEEKALKTAHNLINSIKIKSNKKTSAYWLEWVETVMIYKLPQLNRLEIQKMLGYNDIELKQTRFYQDVFSEGLQEGLQEGETKIILSQLNRRFGNLTPKTINKIQTLTSEQLESLGNNLLDFTVPDDLNSWLKQN